MAMKYIPSSPTTCIHDDINACWSYLYTLRAR